MGGLPLKLKVGPDFPAISHTLIRWSVPQLKTLVLSKLKSIYFKFPCVVEKVWYSEKLGAALWSKTKSSFA